MNTLKLLSIALFISTCVLGQEHKMKMTSGTLKFKEINKLVIEGTSGNEVIMSSEGVRAMPERARGLKPINSMGVEDNTGIGLAVQSEGSDTYLITEVLRNSDATYRVKVPKGINIQVEQQSVHGDDVHIQDISNNVELSLNHSDAYLTNLSGSLLANSVHGDMVVTFSNVSPSNPVSVISAHGEVDVTLPASTKADLKMSSNFGDIFTDLDIDYTVDEGKLRKLTSSIEGKLNGGGTEMYLESRHGNIFLRKK